MAHDKSPPPLRPIVLALLIVVLAMIGLKFAADSYFVAMFEAEEYRKVGSVPATALIALRAAEKDAFAHAPIPIDRAMEIVARGRTAPIAELKNVTITPEPSNERAPLAGWAGIQRTAAP